MNSRRLMWAVLLVAAGTMLLMWHLQTRATDQKPAASAPAAATKPAVASAPATAPAATKPAAPTVPAVREPPDRARWLVSQWSVREVVLGSTDKPADKNDPGFKFRVQLTSLGAAVKTVKLADVFTTVADKHRHQRDPATYAEAVRKNPKLKGYYSLLNPVRTGQKETYPLATRRITIISDGEKVKLDLSGSRWSAGQVQTEKTEDGKIRSQSVTFQSKIYRNAEEFLLVKKTYTLKKGSYSIGVHLEVISLMREGKVEFSLTQFSATGVPREDIQTDNRMLAYGRYEDGELKAANLSSAKDAGKMTPGLTGAQDLGRSDGGEPVLWIGQTNKFFAALTYIIPKDSSKGLAAPHAKAAFFGAALEESATSKTFLAGMNLGPYELGPGKSAGVSLDLFAGPKLRNLFDNTPLYKTLEYKKAIQFGSGCCTFCVFPRLSLGMMWLLDFFSRATFGNYGLAIIMLVVLVRLVLHPLTKKGQVSMARMQKLQPEMAKIKEKYADDKARQNQEMMKLYKTQGTTPILGCLPMLLQMPIWIALWTGLRAAVELRHAAFLPVWITDLAGPDRLIDFGRTLVTLPMVGPVCSFNLLPILLAVAMALQQKFSPTAPQTPGKPAGTQKQMMYFMTGFFLLIFYNAPSGLTLYIMSSTFAGLAEQYVIRKHIREKEAAEAAVETKVSMPGKRFRGQKPKKPKGPFQVKH